MYENITFDVLKNRMLARVPNSLDKREGSLIYNSIAAVAVEFELAYRQLDRAINNCYADTAEMESLIKIAKPFGISPKAATYALVSAETAPANVDVIGKRFTCNELTYVVTECKADDDGVHNRCIAKCEQAGEIGNKYYSQKLVPVEYISGLQTAALGEIIELGAETETEEAFRTRLFESAIAFGGNISDYKQKTLAINGVGGVKVFPWTEEQAGVVGLCIQGTDYSVASNSVQENVQAFFGEYNDGLGLAPIGHTVQVYSAEAVTMKVDYELTLDTGYTREQVLPLIKEKEKAYIAELRQEWGNQNYTQGLTVSVSRLYYNALSVEGVKDAVVHVGTSQFMPEATASWTLAPKQLPFAEGEL